MTRTAKPLLMGIDFTSAPRRAKPIVCCTGIPTAGGFCIQRMDIFGGFAGFESVLMRSGPWIAACDFPLGLPRAFVEDQGWPGSWAGVVGRASALARAEWRALLDAHRAPRPPGDRLPHRSTDRPAGSHSPLKLVNPPVALMFHEGAPRLLRAGVTLPGLHPGDPDRLVVEAYPGMWARRVERASYKADDRARQTPARLAARRRILQCMEEGVIGGLRAEFADDALRREIVEDPAGDLLDAALCVLHAAWCHREGPPLWGMPAGTDPVEGWIPGAGSP